MVCNTLRIYRKSVVSGWGFCIRKQPKERRGGGAREHFPFKPDTYWSQARHHWLGWAGLRWAGLTLSCGKDETFAFLFKINHSDNHAPVPMLAI